MSRTRTLLMVMLVGLVIALGILGRSQQPVHLYQRPYAHDPHARAIDAGLAFLVRHHKAHQPSWQVYALLDFLQRRFGLDERYTIKNTLAQIELPEHEQHMATLMGRIADPNYRVGHNQIVQEENELTRLMAEALYCDTYPPDPTYPDRLMALYNTGGLDGLAGYIKTHVILCFQWLREYGCDSAFPNLQIPWQTFADSLTAIIEREQAATDLAFESMAFLYYMGAAERVREEWITRLLALQRYSGAWGYTPNDRDHAHPTVLAVWVLLEHARHN